VINDTYKGINTLFIALFAQSIAFGSSVVAPKRCTGHHLELLAISSTWMFVLVCYPNVPLASLDPEKKNGETPVVQHLHIRRGALQKRQKAEVSFKSSHG
jgi:hypothetical protein